MNIILLDEGDDPERASAAFRGKVSFEDYKRDNYIGTPAQIADHIHSLAEAGIDYVIAYFPRVAYDQTMLRCFA